MQLDQFTLRIKKAQQSLDTLQVKSNLFVSLRLLNVIAFLLSCYLYTKSPTSIFGPIAATLVLTFAIEVMLHQNIKNSIKMFQLKKKINQEYLNRIDDNWKKFDDTGQDLADLDHPYAFDLDIIGKSSLFQKISICKTFWGRKKLGELLLKTNKEGIEDRQKSVYELSKDLDFLVDLQIQLCDKKEVKKDPGKWLNIENILIHESKILNIMLKIVPITIIGLLFLGNVFLLYAIILIVINLGLCLIDKNRANVALLRNSQYQIEPYLKALSVVFEKEFKSPLLRKKSESASMAIKSLKELEKISILASLSTQPLFGLPLNGILMWDLWIVHLCKKWQDKHGKNLKESIYFLGELEALGSLATLSIIDKTIFPHVTNTNVINGQKLGHPLINARLRVCNSFYINDEILIITGSNMSGKTTFLRTIGINLVLSYAGAGTTAKAFCCGHFSIFTSMRTSDNLGEQTSSFHAEIKRIKIILDAIKAKQPLFFLIDEIFRGTNSKDRINGAIGVLKALKNYGAIGLITTHDLEMCKLEEIPGITNYHFEDFFDNQNMFFDYTLKPGISTKTNAKHLLEMIGVV
ncbi:MAG: hypothetical protein ATN31_05330, partial [Candidatus Epulonipiscioides saccharophilum]